MSHHRDVSACASLAVEQTPRERSLQWHLHLESLLSLFMFMFMLCGLQTLGKVGSRKDRKADGSLYLHWPRASSLHVHPPVSVLPCRTLSTTTTPVADIYHRVLSVSSPCKPSVSHGLAPRRRICDSNAHYCSAQEPTSTDALSHGYDYPR